MTTLNDLAKLAALHASHLTNEAIRLKSKAEKVDDYSSWELAETTASYAVDANLIADILSNMLCETEKLKDPTLICMD